MTEQEKVFGFPPVIGRWFFVAVGIIINLCIGSVYSWSIFKKTLEDILHIGATQSSLPFIFCLSFYALFMTITGTFIDKKGPRIITIIGGSVFSLGLILSSMATNITMLTFTYGMVIGSGIGIIYGAPISVVTKWFPDKKGLAVGLTLLGFGLSSVIMAPVSKQLIDLYGPFATFRILGIVFFAVIILASFFLRVPSASWVEQNMTSNMKSAASETQELRITQLIKSKEFYGLWLCYVIGTLAGLMAIGISSPVAQEVTRLDASLAAVLVSVFAFFNGAGRPVFGWLTDKIGPKYVALISFAMVFTASLIMLNIESLGTPAYILSFCIFWFNLGGWLAIAPAATAIFFGTKHYAKNYGLIFSAYGVGAVLGNLISGSFRDIFGSYIYAFYPTAALTIIGCLIAFFMLNKNIK